MADKTVQNTVSRPPVVVVMGHVDHGKTTLIDYIRKTNVAEREAGNITQSIGAYEIKHGGRKITFIDTPGHEAFTKMRSRGASVADLAILVVAATEGPKPQTLETIKILKETKTPFIVAINKIDDPGADVNKVKNQLTEAGVLLEGYGGSVSYQPISAKNGEGVNELLDLILLAADVEELTYSPAAPASGFVLEAKIDSRRGREVSVVVKDGTLRKNDEISTATAKGKVKILEDFQGSPVKELIPSAPALIIGFEKLPLVGEKFSVGCNDFQAMAKTTKKEIEVISPDDDSAVRIILKSGDAGSLEALSAIIKALASGESDKKICVISESIGDITDGDIKNAIASNAVVIGFKNKVAKQAKNLADIQNVKIITSNIIYDLVKVVEEMLAKPVGPQIKGKLEILAVFNQTKLAKQLVGGKVVEGVFKNKASFDILRPSGAEGEGGVRGEEVIGHGKVLNLQTGKVDANEVEAGKEAGLIINSGALINVGDYLVIK